VSALDFAVFNLKGFESRDTAAVGQLLPVTVTIGHKQCEVVIICDSELKILVPSILSIGVYVIDVRIGLSSNTALNPWPVSFQIVPKSDLRGYCSDRKPSGASAARGEVKAKRRNSSSSTYKSKRLKKQSGGALQLVEGNRGDESDAIEDLMTDTSVLDVPNIITANQTTDDGTTGIATESPELLSEDSDFEFLPSNGRFSHSTKAEKCASPSRHCRLRLIPDDEQDEGPVAPSLPCLSVSDSTESSDTVSNTQQKAVAESLDIPSFHRPSAAELKMKLAEVRSSRF
jgi:hypothetical protein